MFTELLWSLRKALEHLWENGSAGDAERQSFIEELIIALRTLEARRPLYCSGQELDLIRGKLGSGESQRHEGRSNARLSLVSCILFLDLLPCILMALELFKMINAYDQDASLVVLGR